MRNMGKALQNYERYIKKRPAVDLTVGDIRQLYALSDCRYSLICYSFAAGFWTGYRAAKKDSRNK